MTETYVSTDVETDGPIPGPHSMLSMASAAFVLEQREPISTFSANLELLPGAHGHSDTMEWWNTQPEAWAAHRKDLEQPMAVMRRYLSWVKTLPNKPVFVAYPAGFDFMFVYWYLVNFTSQSPFSFSALDVKTYAMAVMKTEFKRSTKRDMPKRWTERVPHTHVALQDAVEQGFLFMNMLRENLGRAKL